VSVTVDVASSGGGFCCWICILSVSGHAIPMFSVAGAIVTKL
jgi:hypothetical protein